MPPRNYDGRGNRTLKLMHQSPLPYCRANRKCLTSYCYFTAIKIF